MADNNSNKDNIVCFIVIVLIVIHNLHCEFQMMLQ